MTIRSGPVVVGVNGSASDDAVMRLGVAEARRLGVPVRLVHVVPDYVAISPLVPISRVDMSSIGKELLHEALRSLESIDDEIEVETELRHGTRARQLAEAAEDAPALVVGRDDRPLMERLLRGNTATGVAATAACPVLVAPSDWRPSPERHAVLVGVKSPTHAHELLADAFEVAAARDADLVVLHTWQLPSGYDDIIESHVTGSDWTQRATHVLETLLVDWRHAYPDVHVEVRVVHAEPAAGLIEASQVADVLVVVRRARGIPAATHLGGTARTLLRLSHCPVRVVPAQSLTELPADIVPADVVSHQK